MSKANPPKVNPTSLLDLWPVWLGWIQRVLDGNRLPLSGDVEQWIKAWGEVVSQIGLLNVNVAGSGDPQLEKTLSSRYSYGRELGRMLDMLAPLVSEQRDLLVQRVGESKVSDFEHMVDEITKLKREMGRA